MSIPLSEPGLAETPRRVSPGWICRSARSRRFFGIPLGTQLTILLAVLGAMWPGFGLAGEWHALAVVRFGNVDAIDADDGALGMFIKNIRNDGRSIPPLRTLIGPEIRNPTFFGITYEAWIEAAIMAPSQAGDLECVWLFPVDSRDEYMAHLSNQGLSEYEGMDGVTVLRETDLDGSVHVWHLEWLPGNVAAFGDNRLAVMAARRLYAENSASRGLLSGIGGQFVEPDVTVRLYPPLAAFWRPAEFGGYWWRERIDKLVDDLVAYWRPNQARERLLASLADAAAVWPRDISLMDCSLWFEPDRLEWTLDVVRDSPAAPPTPPSQLDVLRAMPERAALAYALPVSDASFLAFGQWAGDMLVGAAGGVVTAESRDLARRLFDTLRLAGPRQAAFGWILPPSDKPELAGSRVLITEWERPERLTTALELLREAMTSGSPFHQTFLQMGLEVTWRVQSLDPLVVQFDAFSAGGGMGAPLFSAQYCCVRQGKRWVLVGGAGRADETERQKIVAHRLAVARAAASADGEGSPDARGAFVRMDAGGASLLGFFEPVRFMQIALLEAADWKLRSPDQHEAESTQLAREMLGYGSAGAWSFEGVNRDGVMKLNGGMSWNSLARLSAALGITESIGME